MFKNATTAKDPMNSLPKRIAATLCVILLAAATIASASLAPVSAIAYESNYRQMDAASRDELYSHARNGSVNGTLTEVALEKAYPDADLLLYQDEGGVVAALMAGKIDYGFVSEFYANRFMESNSGYEYVMPAFITFDDAMGVAKGNDELREKINEVLARLRADGTVDAVNKKWLVDRNYTMDDVPVREDGEVLRVASTGTDEPYTFIYNGEQVGYSREIVMRIAYELGYRVEFQDMSFSSLIASVVSGKCDIALQLMATDERRQQIDFTDSYVSLNYGALAKSDSAETAGFLQTFVDNFNSTFIVENRWQLVLGGLGVTCLITAGAFVLGTAAAAGLCLMKRCRRAAVRGLARVYVRLATGIPVLVWLMILYYMVFAGVPIPAAAVAIICFGLQMAAPISEVFDTGLSAVSPGEIEATVAMGFSRTMAFRRVVLPQAAARVWPLYTGQLTALIKATSIVGYIAIQDLTKVSDIIRSRTFQAFFPLLATAVVYFAVIALCTWALGRVGRRLDPKRRPAEAVLKGIVTRG